MITQADADSGHDLQNAVVLALNGTLNEDHIGPEEMRRLEKVIAANAMQANKITLSVIEQRDNRKRLGSVYVTNVAKLTVSNDKTGASQVLRRYVALIDSAISERTNSDSDNNRIEKLREARSHAKAFEMKWIK